MMLIVNFLDVTLRLGNFNTLIIMEKQYTRQDFEYLTKEDCVNIILKLQQDIIDLEKLVNNSVSDKEFAVILALRNMITDRVNNSIEVHEEYCHYQK